MTRVYNKRILQKNITTTKPVYNLIIMIKLYTGFFKFKIVDIVYYIINVVVYKCKV